MNSLTDFIVNFGDVVELDFSVNVDQILHIVKKHPEWKIYQPHKPGYNRFGLSVTSIDGGYSGEPDLYSLREYNLMHGTTYDESHFKKRTNITTFLPDVEELLNFFEPNLGRTHFLRLDKGGFFPPHRDNGAIVAVPTFRILVPINNFGINDVKWIQEEQILNLKIGQVYFINTTKIHSIFSFVDDCIMLVLNVYWSTNLLAKLVRRIATI